MFLIELIKAVLFGIVEGITEWLPISSTGHLILLQDFVQFKNQDPAFMEMFNVVIQLGAILAVVVIYFDKLYPFKPGNLHSKYGGLGNYGQKLRLQRSHLSLYLN